MREKKSAQQDSFLREAGAHPNTPPTHQNNSCGVSEHKWSKRYCWNQKDVFYVATGRFNNTAIQTVNGTWRVWHVNLASSSESARYVLRSSSGPQIRNAVLGGF